MGLITATSGIVVQLGFAMIFLGHFFNTSGFTSGTTSGTSGSWRNAVDLSITIHPAFAAIGAYCNETSVPAAKKAKSVVEKSNVLSASTNKGLSRNKTVLPMDFSLASGNNFSTGKSRSANNSNSVSPTMPVTPIIAMLYFFIISDTNDSSTPWPISLLQSALSEYPHTDHDALW